MTNRFMDGRVENKIDTSERWEIYNPVLLSGELGIAVITKDSGDETVKIKVGDGISHWNDLKYVTSGEDISVDGTTIVNQNGILSAVSQVSADETTITDNDGTFSVIKPDFYILDCGGALALNEIASISIVNTDGTAITSLALSAGSTYQISITDADGNIYPSSNFTYTSSNSNVVVDSNGVINVTYTNGMDMNIEASITVSTL